MNWNKGMKWIVAVFAALVLMSVFVGAVSGEEISSITLTGVTGPVAGQTPQTSGISAGDKLNVGSCEWKTESGNSVGSSFDYNTVYKLIIPITIKDNNNTLSETTSVISNKGEARYADRKVTITFPKTAELTTISDTVAIMLTPPETGVSKSIPSSSEHTHATVTWRPALSNDKFSGGVTYTAEITVTADSGYIFSESVSVKLNNADATKELSSDKKSLTVIKEFPTTEQTDTVLSTVNLEITAPATGAAPATSVTGTNIVSDSVTWSPAVSSTFAADTQYKATIKVTPATGHVFPSSKPTVKVNGNTVDANKVSLSGNVLTTEYTFSKTDKTISSVSLTITAPAAGAAPATSVTGTNIVSDSVTWSPAVSSTFAADTQYKATIKVKSAAGYKFGSTPTVTVNGKSVAAAKVSVSSSKDTLTITEYTIGSTGGEISSVSLNVDAPALGEKPDTTVTPESSANYDVSSITWYKTSVGTDNELDTDKAFEGKTVYIAKIKLTAKDGYVFDSPMEKESVKINDKAVSADITPTNNNKELTLEYTFPATAEAKKPVITLTADPANPVMKAGLDSVTVKFIYKITEDFDSASISFGDSPSGETITQDGGTISHTYTSASTFTVTLRAGNENGITTKTLSLPITKEKFKASFDASLLSGEAPLKVLFTDTSTGTSGKVVQRSWDFDDGTTAASQPSVTHTFEKEGTYYVQLFVSDGLNQDSARKTITVTGKNGGNKPATVDVDYEPFLIIGDVGVPSPFDLIAEFVRLIQAMLNFDNYTFSDEES